MVAGRFLCLAMHDIELVAGNVNCLQARNVVVVWPLADDSAMSPVPIVKCRAGFGLGEPGLIQHTRKA
jgi:hypothetical protein